MNTILVKIWIFNLDFPTILSFLLGIIVGFVLVCLIYAVLVVASLGDKKFFVKTKDDSLTTTEVKDMIVTAQKTFKDKSLRGKKKRMAFATEIGKDLAYGIATRFYPKSKYPLLELSVDEAIMLTEYIKERLETILNRRGIKLLKRFKIADIVNITTASNKVMKSEAFKVTKTVSGVATKIKNVLNVINPIILFRKYVIGATFNLIIDKLCCVALAVVGEETYKIYSKRVFNKEVEIDSNIDEILTDIDNDFKNAANEKVDEDNVEDEIKDISLEKEEIRLMGKSFKNVYSSNEAIDINYDMPLMEKNISEVLLDEKEEDE